MTASFEPGTKKHGGYTVATVNVQGLTVAKNGQEDDTVQVDTYLWVASFARSVRWTWYTCRS